LYFKSEAYVVNIEPAVYIRAYVQQQPASRLGLQQVIW
jgi:hypothetical protein